MLNIVGNENYIRCLVEPFGFAQDKQKSRSQDLSTALEETYFL